MNVLNSSNATPPPYKIRKATTTAFRLFHRRILIPSPAVHIPLNLPRYTGHDIPAIAPNLQAQPLHDLVAQVLGRQETKMNVCGPDAPSILSAGEWISSHFR